MPSTVKLNMVAVGKRCGGRIANEFEVARA